MALNYSTKQKETMQSVRQSLTDLLTVAVKTNESEERIGLLKETLRMMEDMFLVVVVGEFNAGKSSFINALLNTEALPEGVTPTTAQINLIRYGSEQRITNLEQWGLLVTIPSPLLESMSFVDTPGTNTVIQDHEALTKWFLPRADMVMFLTSTDRPFSESESHFLESISDWGKKVVIILNKIDLLKDDADRTKVIDFVSSNALKYLKYNVPVLPVSARLAKQARAEVSEELWKESGFLDLEKFIQTQMDDQARFRMKMESSINLGIKFSGECIKKLNEETSFYNQDQALADSIDSQIHIFQDDMIKEVNRSMREISSIFMIIKQRGLEYYDELFRVKNIPNLIRKDRNQIEFQESVLQNLPIEIERKTTEMVTTISTQQQRMVNTIMNQIESRRSEYVSSVIPQEEQTERAELLKSMQAAIDEMLEKIEKDIALNIGMKHAQNAVAAGLAIEVSAIGLGAALTIVATSVASDVLGIIAAFWVGVAGFLVLPYYKKKAVREFNEKMDDVEKKLVSSLSDSMTNEINTQVHEMDQTIQPFRRFVQSALERAHTQIEKLNGISEELNRIKTDL